MLNAEKEGTNVSLGERITLARKQAGLSQEQLGEKLGVSRQAVSKWESGQTNPDVTYVARMCRLLEVSSDWLLLGEEDARSVSPGQRSGRPPRDADGSAPGYTMLLKPFGLNSSPAADLIRLSKSGLFPEDSPLHGPLDWDRASTLAAGAPCVLARGLSREQVFRAWDATCFPRCFHFVQDRDETDPRVLIEFPGIDPKTMAFSSPEEPMSFGMTVLAVIVGIVGAVLLLMFL